MFDNVHSYGFYHITREHIQVQTQKPRYSQFCYWACTANAVYKGTEERLNAVCITRTFAYACWLLRHFSDRCEDNNFW